MSSDPYNDGMFLSDRVHPFSYDRVDTVVLRSMLVQIQAWLDATFPHMADSKEQFKAQWIKQVACSPDMFKGTSRNLFCPRLHHPRMFFSVVPLRWNHRNQ